MIGGNKVTQYTCKKVNDRYILCEDDHVLTTPAGNPVGTMYEALAQRMLTDLEKYGKNTRSGASVLPWHYTMLDSFAPMRHEQVEQILARSFLSRVDWTCRVNLGAEWKNTFGKWNDRKEYIEQWLSEASFMQMTAACCIGNAYGSLNLAMALALALEKNTGKERDDRLTAIAMLVADTYQFGSFEDIYDSFKTFELYYGIHLEEDGPILVEIIPDSDDDDDLDVNDLTNYSVTVEQLVGRNYYHYTDYERDEVQPAVLEIRDIEINESEEDDEDDYSDEDMDEEDDEETDGIYDYLPDDCWVKRIIDDDDADICYLLYLEVGEDGKVQSSGCIEETTQRMGGGGFFFAFPGMDMGGVKSYDDCPYPPDKVIAELRLLLKGRTIPTDFTFVGKRLPQAMIDEGGNGGSNTEYTYALQSSFRLAYMHMSVDTTAEGTIEGFSYSSYQSTGSGYGDMFSRPIVCPDRRDEAVDMLLHIYDMYTDVELGQINKTN